jgi:hypothetical protein
MQAGLPVIRFHDIRHSAASIMLLHGEPPVRVAGILGQSIAVLMDTYAHYIEDSQEEVASLMDELTTPISIGAAADLLHTNCTTVAPDYQPLQQKLSENQL